MGDFENEVKTYEALLQVNPSNPIAMKELPFAYARCRQWEKSLQMSQQLIEREPTHEDGYLALAIAHSALDRDAEAIPIYQEALRIKPDLPFAIANLGLSYLAVGRLREAADALERAINLKRQTDEDCPPEAEMRVRLGETYAKLGDLEGAHQQLCRLKETDQGAAKELSRILAAIPDAASGPA